MLYREYIEGTLQTPLQKDSIYRVEFFVSRAENQALCNRATDRIGVYFHQKFIVPKVYDNQTPFIINAKPQVENRYGRILYDTAGWTAVCGYFKAKGGEAYLTIGNFYDDLHTPYVQTSPTIDHSCIYYYIDDVSVEKVPQQNSPFLFTDNTVICALDSVSNYQVPAALTQVLWSTGDTIHTLDIPGAGQFWVQALLDDGLFTDTFQIKYIPPPQFAFPADSAEICSTALPLTLQTCDCCASLLWSTGDTTKSAKIFQPGWVWLQENNVCKTLRDSLYLSITEPPPLDLGRDTALCDTTQFIRTLIAPPDMDAYRWSTGDMLPFITITQPGSYWVEVKNVCGTFTDTLVVKDLRLDRLQLMGDTMLCLTTPLVIQAEPTFDTYTWSTGESARQIEVQDYGNYRLSVTNACGLQVDSVNITEANHPALGIAAPGDIYLGDSVQLLPIVQHDKPVRYTWAFSPYLEDCKGCAEPFVRPFVSSVFQLTVTDTLGCTATAGVAVNVLENQRIYLPNVFSPNGDGQNDRLTVYFGGEVETLLFAAVFNRWGEKMTESKNLPVAQSLDLWDGYYRGKRMGTGVYTVALEIRLLDDRVVRVVADVTLVQ